MSPDHADRVHASDDPLVASLGLTLLFFALCLWRIEIPGTHYFDEIHYLPAARELLAGTAYRNPEHPPLGKEIIAAGIALFGDNPWGWRFFPVLAGSATMFAAMRALWHVSHRQAATLAYGVLLATGFILFVQSRIAMLDIFMAAFVMIALWLFAAACTARTTARARRNLALAGIAIGCALASKWNTIPVAPVFGLAFLGIRWRAVGAARLLTDHQAPPVRGVSLVEAALWLGLVPVMVYAITFWPAYVLPKSPFAGLGPIASQEYMLGLQMSVKAFHPYQTHWSDWVLNTRGIWYAFNTYDGAQRGIMLIGNPLTMWLGLVALTWCAYAAVFLRRPDAAAVVILYAASILFWIVAAKPVQFYYHYFLPSCFQLAALALAIDRLRELRQRWAFWLVLAGSVALFAYFYPILSACALEDKQAFLKWAWLKSWI